MGPEVVILVTAACLAGSAVGTFSGLVPGIHVNTLASVMLLSYPAMESFLVSFTEAAYVPIVVSSCIMSASVVHSFVDFVPSVFIGAPDPDETMAVLPGHRLLMCGLGMRAVRAAAVGSAVGAASAIVLAIPIQYLMLSGLAAHLDIFTVSVILFTLSVIILKEHGIRKKLWSLVLIAMSGMMGLICMDLHIPSAGVIGEGTLLFPLLTGLFGIPALLSSLGTSSVPKQRDDGISPVDCIPGIKGVIMGSLAGWYPGITATAGATLSSVFLPENKPERFISIVASIGTVTSVFSLVTLSVSGSGRSGTVLVIREIIGDSVMGFCSPEFLLLLFCSALSSFLGYHITISSGRVMSKIADRLDKNLMNRAVICFVIFLVILMTGPVGILVLTASVIIGMIPSDIGMDRIPLAGCLMFPVLVHGILEQIS
ncbi:MAG: tripartite tricarboxylate transporter permease [Candidatus Methanoplasma sp.]|jgi:putative membrane protein|nr:tripartite tricarboxylate transporter permease [Candidatus Methanoplasma sp.]